MSNAGLDSNWGVPPIGLVPEPQGHTTKSQTILIVAAGTINSRELSIAVSERVPGKFHLIVPLSREPILPVFDGISGAETAARDLLALENRIQLARQRLTAGTSWLHSLGAAATGEVGFGDPLVAVTTKVAADSVVEVIVAAMPTRVSRWLKQDLPNRIARAVPVPVNVVSAHQKH